MSKETLQEAEFSWVAGAYTSKEIDNLLREDILQEAEVRRLVEFSWLAGAYMTFEDFEDQGMFL